MEGTIGEIRGFAGNFAPRGWAFCQGQLLSVSQNEALFSILGTIYGGDGRTTFALPDLRGRVPIGEGTGPGLTPRWLGLRSGTEINYLTVNQLPAHNHFAVWTQTAGVATMPASTEPATSEEPGPNLHMSLAEAGGKSYIYGNGTPDTRLQNGTASVAGTVTLKKTGGNQAFNNIQPFLTIHWIICMIGEYPSRS
ncbi:MAG: phage tail protein [Marinifilaceae bacterium]